MIDFEAFRAGPGARICAQLGVDVSRSLIWQALSNALVDHNDRTGGAVVEAARVLNGTGSTGERAVLHAVLAAADFAWLADELAAGGVWQRWGYLDREHRLAVAAVTARLDSQPGRPGRAGGDVAAAGELISRGLTLRRAARETGIPRSTLSDALARRRAT